MGGLPVRHPRSKQTETGEARTVSKDFQLARAPSRRMRKKRKKDREKEDRDHSNKTMPRVGVGVTSELNH